MARLLTTEGVLEELDLEDDYDDDEPMMPGSDDEFSDLEDVEDDDDNNDCDFPPPSSPNDQPGSGFSDSGPLPSLS